MSLSPEMLADLKQCVESLYEGELTSDQAGRLHNLLEKDAEARRQYVQLVAFYESMKACCGMLPAASDGIQDDAHHEESHSSSLPPIPTFESPDISTSFFSSGWPLAYLIATVICVIGVIIGAVTHVSQPTDIAQHFNNSNPQSLIPNPSPKATIVARITGTADCRWEKKVASGEWPVASEEPGARDSGLGARKSEIPKSRNPQIPKSLVSLGDHFILSSGLMEITYNTGARVILQGPCTYEVDSRDGGFLAIGKLTARVETSTKYGVRSTEQAAGDIMQIAKCKMQIANCPSPNPEIPKSPNPSLTTTHYPLTTNSNPQSLIPNPLFSIRTPTATITDLGTEFGVEVLDSGVTETHVLQGAVKVRSTLGGGDGEVERIFYAGSAVRCDGKEHKFVSMNAKEQRFVRKMPATDQARQDDAEDYSRLVLSMKPAVYYRMEPPPADKQNMVLDSSGGGHDGVLSFSNEYSGEPYVAGRFGKCLHFRGLATKDHVIVPDYPKAADDCLTVSAWVMAVGRNPWSVIAASWGRDADGTKRWGQFQFGMFHDDGDLVVQSTQRNGQLIQLREGPDRPLPLGEWQHIAFVIDRTVANVYRNGKQVASGPIDGILPQPAIKSLGIGCNTNTAGTELAPGAESLWLGRIDELAIFNRALSKLEIQSLFLPSQNAKQDAHP